MRIYTRPNRFACSASARPSVFSKGLNRDVGRAFGAMTGHFACNKSANGSREVCCFGAGRVLRGHFNATGPVPFHMMSSGVKLSVSMSVHYSNMCSCGVISPLLFCSGMYKGMRRRCSHRRLSDALGARFVSTLRPTFNHLSRVRLHPGRVMARGASLRGTVGATLSRG